LKRAVLTRSSWKPLKDRKAGHITFEDPDAVITVETISQWAGLSLWRREDAKVSFVRVD
jgi:hypothetical protein